MQQPATAEVWGCLCEDGDVLGVGGRRVQGSTAKANERIVKVDHLPQATVLTCIMNIDAVCLLNCYL